MAFSNFITISQPTIIIPNAEYVNKQVSALLVLFFYFLIFVVATRLLINHLDSHAQKQLTKATDRLRSTRIEKETTEDIIRTKQRSMQGLNDAISQCPRNIAQKLSPNSPVYRQATAALSRVEERYREMQGELADAQKLVHEQRMAWSQAFCRFHEARRWCEFMGMLSSSSFFDIVFGRVQPEGKIMKVTLADETRKV